MTLYSHPDQTLQNHLLGVLKAVHALWEGRSFVGWESLEEKERLRNLISIAAIFHDFGKSTSYFQNYILSKEKKKNPYNRHALLSAVVGYYVAKQGFNDYIFDPYETLILFLAIKRHHFNMNNLFSEVNVPQEEVSILLKQAKAVDYSAWNKLVSNLTPFLPLSIRQMPHLNESEVIRWMQLFFEQDIPFWRRKIRREFTTRSIQSTRYYFKYCSFYSLLLDADKHQASLQDKLSLVRREINPGCVDVYRRKQLWQKSAINSLRERAYQEVMQNINRYEGQIFSINLPTGLGKTIISLKTALLLRERRLQETGIAPRIIYALPFLSVIDQNATVFEQVLKMNNSTLDPFVLMRHHSLVDPYEAMFHESEYDFDENQARVLMEGWQSEVVCTTFVQLFQTLISHRNRSLRKFHRLSHSILIIDEIQAVPVKFWPLFREMLLQLTMVNTDVILTTATQPKLFEVTDEVIELCDREVYFAHVNRVTIFPQIASKQTIEEFVESVIIKDQFTYLFILNTIASAKELYCLLKTKVDGPIAFLSTHIPPIERLKRIDEIKQGKYRIVVSTQLVEAGVDIDFDIVYRDLAPLESVVQSAGRCNRNGIKTGEVYVIQLWNGKRSFASLIYSPVVLEITINLLNKHTEIKEQKLFSLIESYYDDVQGKLRKTESEKYLNAVKTLYFEGEEDIERIPVSHFKLIEEDYKKMDVFIELNEQASKVWDSYEKIISMKNDLKRYQEWNKLKIKFQDYVISVPAHVENKPPIVHGHFYVGKSDLDNFYDIETGYKTEGVTAIW